MRLRETLGLAATVAALEMGCGASQPSAEISNVTNAVVAEVKGTEVETQLPHGVILDQKENNETLQKAYANAMKELTSGDYNKGKALFDAAWVVAALPEMALDAGDIAIQHERYEDALNFYKRALLATDDELVKADAQKKINEAQILVDMGK